MSLHRAPKPLTVYVDRSRWSTHAFHDHHDMTVSTLHMHLDHDSWMEVAVLKGRAGAVIAFSEQVIAEHGVKHGRLVMVPVQLSSERHAHGDHGKRPHEHAHVR